MQQISLHVWHYTVFTSAPRGPALVCFISPQNFFERLNLINPKFIPQKSVFFKSFPASLKVTHHWLTLTTWKQEMLAHLKNMPSLRFFHFSKIVWFTFDISPIFTYWQHPKVKILFFQITAAPSVRSVIWKLEEIIFDKLVDLLKSFPKTLIERRKVLKVQLVKSRKENTLLRKVEFPLGPNWVFCRLWQLKYMKPPFRGKDKYRAPEVHLSIYQTYHIHSCIDPYLKEGMRIKIPPL